MSYFDRNEWEADTTFDFEMRKAEISKAADKHIWTTKDGTKVKVEDMTDSHLLNTYRYLERTDTMDLYLSWLMVLQDEIERRGLSYDFRDLFF